MQPYQIALVIIAAVIIFIILLLFLLAALCYKIGFSSRCDRNSLLKYFEGKDFGLSERDVEIKKDKIILRGKIYGNSSDKLIIFCHGLGAGHLAYTTEISYFCRHGAEVLAVDYEGCNLSGGKSIRGMYSGAECVIAAVRFAKSLSDYKDKKIWLVGHSWGGYSALCAAQREKVDGVVAISAPDSATDVLYYNAAGVLGKFICVLMKPFWNLINFIKFGKYGNAHASGDVLDGTSVLVVQGDNDNVVPLQYSAYGKMQGNVHKLLCKGKSHNPYNSPAAQAMLIELSQKLMLSRKMTEKEKSDYFGNFDFASATEEDEEVMQKIADFIG